MADRETIIETGDGGAAGIVAGLLAVTLVVVCLFVFFGMSGPGSQVIDLDLPATTVNLTPDAQ